MRFRLKNQELIFPSNNGRVTQLQQQNNQLRRNLERTQALVTEKDFVINNQKLEIKKLRNSTVSIKNQLDQVNYENSELERKISKLQDLLNRER